jgi:hypothetical protein
METGVYILNTSDGFRVAYSEEYINLFGDYDDNTNSFVLNSELLFEIFNNCFVYDNIELATNEAIRISQLIGETDNGIMNIKYPRYTFEELTNGSKASNT